MVPAKKNSFVALPVSLMISMQTLRYLVSNKMRDARILAANRRFPAAVYIAGYAVEIALKYKVCLSLRFEQGFPETSSELSETLTRVNRYRENPLAIHLQNIRTHNFESLRLLSGTDEQLTRVLADEWIRIRTWGPEIRYKKRRLLKNQAFQFLNAAEKIIKIMR